MTDLSQLMREHRIQRLYMSPDGKCFSVSLYSEGEPIYATGTTIGEAYAEADRCRQVREERRAA